MGLALGMRQAKDATPNSSEGAGQHWLVLLPRKWNPSSGTCPYGWRYTPEAQQLIVNRTQGAHDEG